jgi:iron(III) transport system permease protein
VAGPVLAAVARFTPVGVLIVAAAHRRLSPLLQDAARVFAPPGWRRWISVEAPVLGPVYGAAACAVFALTLGELGATLLVAPPGYATATMRIYNYLHYGASQTVAGLSLVMAVATMLAGLVCAACLGRAGRVSPAARRRSH